jgi:hypothetical protein
LNKILSIKLNAIFLAAVLVVGTFATISPSFIIGVNAQSEPYYEKDARYSNYEQEQEPMDKGYSAYEPDYPKYPDKKYNNFGPDYPPKYTDDRKYNNYESDYGMDNDRKSYKTNSYETTTSYGNDNNYQKTYGKDDSYDKPQYSSYKPDYKPQYPSYGKDKSNKDSSSVSINKLNCINNNVNINGNNTGDINIGNKGSSGTGEGYLGVGSYGDEGYGKQDKGSDCIINNNNTNINIVAGGGGNVTDGNVTETTATLAVTKNVTCTPNDTSPLAAAACQFIRSNVLPSSFNITVTGDNPNPSQFTGSNVSAVVVNLGAGIYEVSEEVPLVLPPIAGVSIIRNTSFAGDCTDVNPTDPQSTEARGTIEAEESQTCDIRNDFRPFSLPQPVGLAAFNTNTDTSAFDINTAGGLAPSFSSPPTVAQGTTEEDLSALEKTTKLKQQWLELLP